MIDVATTISQGSMINMFANDVAYYRIIQSHDIVQKDVDFISSLILYLASYWSLMQINVV